MTPCTDQVIGDILSSWRYDISGISPEMRTDFEQHFVECQHCRSRQRLHRTVDVTLIGLATLSTLAFLLAQQQDAQHRQRRDEDSESADVHGEVRKAEAFRESADAHWQKIGHRE